MDKKVYMQPMAHTTEIDTLSICTESGFATSTIVEVDNDGYADPRKGWDEL